jgi:hypothetical protein
MPPTGSRGGGSSTVAAFLAAARRQLGDTYTFGAEGPGTFDCSGLVYFAAQRAGLGIARSTANGYMGALPDVARNNLQPGDLVFFNYGRLGRGQADHVGIYIGNGKMIDASSSLDRIVMREVDWDNYIGGGRIAGLQGRGQTEAINQALAGRGGPGGGGQGGGFDVWAQQDKITKQEIRGILRGFGLNPSMFDELIDQAVRKQWSEYEFQAAVYDSDVFAETFPGIFNKDGSLKMTPAEWQQLAFGEGGYQDVSRQFGVKMNRRKIGELIEGNVGVPEWQFRASVMKRARESEEDRKAFNQLIRASGQPEMNKKGWFDFIANATDPRIENLYEALELTTAEGLDIGRKEALRASKQIGEPGERVDPAELVASVLEVKDFIAPELEAAGISDATLAVVKAGGRPEIAGQLEQLLRNRNALVGRQLASAGSTAGGGLFPELSEGL